MGSLIFLIPTNKEKIQIIDELDNLQDGGYDNIMASYVNEIAMTLSHQIHTVFSKGTVSANTEVPMK